MDVEHIMRIFTWISSTNITISSVQEKDPTYLSEFTFVFLVLECSSLYWFLHISLLFNLLKKTCKILAEKSGNNVCSFHRHVSLIEESCPEKKKEWNIGVFLREAKMNYQTKPEITSLREIHIFENKPK